MADAVPHSVAGTDGRPALAANESVFPASATTVPPAGGGGVGGRHHGANDEGEVGPHAGGEVEDGGYDAGGDDDAGRGEDGDAGDGGPQLADVDAEGGVEDQARQQDDEHDLRADLEVLFAEDLRRRKSQDNQGDGVGNRDEPYDQRRDDGDRHQRDRDFDGVEPEHAFHNRAF